MGDARTSGAGRQPRHSERPRPRQAGRGPGGLPFCPRPEHALSRTTTNDLRDPESLRRVYDPQRESSPPRLPFSRLRRVTGGIGLASEPTLRDSGDGSRSQLPMVLSATRNCSAVRDWFQPRRLRISRISKRAAGE